MTFPNFCHKCGIAVDPTLEGFLAHIRTEMHNQVIGYAK